MVVKSMKSIWSHGAIFKPSQENVCVLNLYHIGIFVLVCFFLRVFLFVCFVFYCIIPIMTLVPTALLAESTWYRITHSLSDCLRFLWTPDPEGSFVIFSSSGYKSWNDMEYNSQSQCCPRAELGPAQFQILYLIMKEGKTVSF